MLSFNLSGDISLLTAVLYAGKFIYKGTVKNKNKDSWCLSRERVDVRYNKTFKRRTCAVVSIALVTIITDTHRNFNICLTKWVWTTRWRTGRYSSWKKAMIKISLQITSAGTEQCPNQLTVFTCAVSSITLKTLHAETDIGSFSVIARSVGVTLVCFRIFTFINICKQIKWNSIFYYLIKDAEYLDDITNEFRP